MIEALGGLLAWAIVRAIIFELPDETAWWKVVLLFALDLALALGLLAAAFIDLDHMYLPDEITLGGAVLGLISVPLRGGTFQGALLALHSAFCWSGCPSIFCTASSVACRGWGSATPSW